MTKSFQLKDWVQSPAWFWAFVIATGLSFVAYALNAIFSEINSGNVWGLTYGTIASLLMVAAALYGLRRRKMSFVSKYKLGKSQTWVQYHIYGGTLFLLLIFMHVGFKLPKGPLNWLMWILSIWVTLSGLFGVFLQKWIPKILTSGLAIEVIYERIPELINDIRGKAEDLIQSCAEPIRDFYIKNLAPTFQEPNMRLVYYLDITGGIQSQIQQFDYLRGVLSAEDNERLRQLEYMYKTKLEIDAHYTLQKALRWWLFMHVPLSLVLLILVALHLYAVFFY